MDAKTFIILLALYLRPNFPLDPDLLRILHRVPETDLFDEHWLRQQLLQAGYFDYVLGVQWPLMAGLLTIRGLSPSGNWQLARTTAPVPATAPPALYVPATDYEESVSGAHYPALPEALARRLSLTQFAHALQEDEPPAYRTLAELTARLGRPSCLDWYLREALHAAGPLAGVYQQCLPRVCFGDYHLPNEALKLLGDDPISDLPLDVLTFEFNRYTEPLAAIDTLTSDLCLANYLLFLHAHPYNGQLTALVQLPEGLSDLAATLAALPAYCERRFQAWGCRCRSQNPQQLVLVGAAGATWLHPTLRRLALGR